MEYMRNYIYIYLYSSTYLSTYLFIYSFICLFIVYLSNNLFLRNTTIHECVMKFGGFGGVWKVGIDPKESRNLREADD